MKSTSVNATNLSEQKRRLINSSNVIYETIKKENKDTGISLEDVSEVCDSMVYGNLSGMLLVESIELSKKYPTIRSILKEDDCYVKR